jgi:hypothetical protein
VHVRPLLNFFVTPVLYVFVVTLRERIRGGRSPAAGGGNGRGAKVGEPEPATAAR